MEKWSISGWDLIKPDHETHGWALQGTWCFVRSTANFAPSSLMWRQLFLFQGCSRAVFLWKMLKIKSSEDTTADNCSLVGFHAYLCMWCAYNVQRSLGDGLDFAWGWWRLGGWFMNCFASFCQNSGIDLPGGSHWLVRLYCSGCWPKTLWLLGDVVNTNVL